MTEIGYAITDMDVANEFMLEECRAWMRWSRKSGGMARSTGSMAN